MTSPTASRAVRLRRADCNGPGIRRRRHGRGFRYVSTDGERLDDPEILERIGELVIPPAWEDVWICPYPGGHIQATGIDARGRKQYLYHSRWREQRDRQKFDDMLAFAKRLRRMRDRVEADLAGPRFSREQILACSVRLLDRGFFRIGTEDYAVENETYGLATIRREHVTVRGETLVFDYPAKHGKRRVQAILDEDVAAIVSGLLRRRGGGEELLAFKRDRRWIDVKSADINVYVKQAVGRGVSAKDFRTWGATVLAAVSVAVAEPHVTSKTARKRAETNAVREVAHYLGNTPAVARGSYIDPRVFDRFAAGETIAAALPKLGAHEGAPAIQGPIERAVLRLLDEGPVT
ncbi:MAG: DNA topoisomerase IB [Solirubrobacteraceae bacterium]|nr:DNA topoisomerase IB [Solirubrobacteraceae bacterium]